ncbi:hypothetical protein RPATATE_1431 [Rickettsia parkeri str. Tate's Hell]|uniref:Uncharacterized protein n=1 Tax=Rickettsia parkeri str. Tate's Hell TaxID=1359189 RepID=A0ABR5DQZ2_RICPA|nr:hypothetical protein [Rickettsia parkeri]KJV96714.1 hypothetical protein RPAAT24_1092 [Rickettsia parkeri str. AT\
MQILDSIEKFTDNKPVIQAYRYVLNLQIKELSLFEEMLSGLNPMIAIVP